MPSEVYDNITYSFSNVNVRICEASEWISIFISQFIMDDNYFSMVGLKFIHVNKKGL